MSYGSSQYYCENSGCNYSEFSSVGNPLYGFEDKLINMSVCSECLKKLEEEKEERERIENEMNEAA